MPRGRPRKQVQQVVFEMKQSQEIQALIREMVQENNIDTGSAKVCGLMVTPSINKTTAGRCIRAGKELKFFSDYDYIIQISRDYWDNLTEQARKILVLHEVMHIDIRYTKQGKEVFGMRQHDVEDFAVLLEKYGLHWLREVKLVQEHLKDKAQDE